MMSCRRYHRHRWYSIGTTIISAQWVKLQRRWPGRLGEWFPSATARGGSRESKDLPVTSPKPFLRLLGGTGTSLTLCWSSSRHQWNHYQMWYCGDLHLGGHLFDPILHLGPGGLFCGPEHGSGSSLLGKLWPGAMALCWPMAPTKHGGEAVAQPSSGRGRHRDTVSTVHAERQQGYLSSWSVVVLYSACNHDDLILMRRLPEDPDRATLVTNLFLEIWAASIALRLMITGEESLSASSYSDFASLTSIGTLWVIISVLLYHFPSAWGSVELVTWTLNVGVLGVGAGTSGHRPGSSSPGLVGSKFYISRYIKLHIV